VSRRDLDDHVQQDEHCGCHRLPQHPDLVRIQSNLAQRKHDSCVRILLRKAQATEEIRDPRDQEQIRISAIITSPTFQRM
jgi:hypothetical protein